MFAYAGNTQSSKSQWIAKSVLQKHSISKPTFQFSDNRPEAVSQRKLQAATDNSQQVVQLRAFQEVANQSKKKKIDLFPEEVIRKIAKQDPIEHMSRLPNAEAMEKPLILEEYAKRIFDVIYEPTIGRLEKPIMDSRIGNVLKFFGVSELKSPIRDKVFDKLYGLVDQTDLDSDNKKMVKETLKAAMKQNWDKNHLPKNTAK